MSKLLVIASEGPLMTGLRRAITYATFWSPRAGHNPLDALVGPQPRSLVVLDLVTPPPPAMMVVDALTMDATWSTDLRRHVYLAIRPGFGLPEGMVSTLKNLTTIETIAAHEPFANIVNAIHQMEMRVLEDKPR